MEKSISSPILKYLYAKLQFVKSINDPGLIMLIDHPQLAF